MDDLGECRCDNPDILTGTLDGNMVEYCFNCEVIIQIISTQRCKETADMFDD